MDRGPWLSKASPKMPNPSGFDVHENKKKLQWTPAFLWCTASRILFPVTKTMRSGTLVEAASLPWACARRGTGSCRKRPIVAERILSRRQARPTHEQNMTCKWTGQYGGVEFVCGQHRRSGTGCFFFCCNVRTAPCQDGLDKRLVERIDLLMLWHHGNSGWQIWRSCKSWCRVGSIGTAAPATTSIPRRAAQAPTLLQLVLHVVSVLPRTPDFDAQCTLLQVTLGVADGLPLAKRVHSVTATSFSFCFCRDVYALRVRPHRELHPTVQDMHTSPTSTSTIGRHSRLQKQQPRRRQGSTTMRRQKLSSKTHSYKLTPRLTWSRIIPSFERHASTVLLRCVKSDRHLKITVVHHFRLRPCSESL